MRLFKEVLIETAEQAEALPPSTPVIIGPFVAMRPGAEKTWGMSYTDGDYTSAELVASFPDYDLTALVPIEAEEETNVVTRAGGLIDLEKYPYAGANFDSDGNVWFGDGWPNVRDVTDEFNEWARNNQRTRYVTPWEPA